MRTTPGIVAVRSLIITLTLCGLLSTRLFAQYHSRTIDLRDTVGASYFRAPLDLPGAILVKGYLDGDLQGYSFPFLTEETKWLPPEFMPDKWRAGEYYYSGDLVTHNGDVYSMRMETNSREPKGDDDFWTKIDWRGAAVAWNRKWPARSDTLPLQEFFQRMRLVEGIAYDTWEPGYDYYQLDRVSHNGVAYECLRDSRGKDPSTSPDDWERSYFQGPLFAQASQLSGVDVLCFQKDVNDSVVDIPQMVTVTVFDEAVYFYRRVVSFYYKDVVEYLSKLQLPTAAKTSGGYIGSKNLLLDDTSHVDLLRIVNEQLRAGKLTVSKKNVLNATLLKAFVSDPFDVVRGLNDWSIYQSPRGGNVCLGTNYPDGRYDAFAMIDLKKLIPILAKGEFKTASYFEILDSYLIANFNGEDFLDSIAPVYASRMLPPMRTNAPNVFYDTYVKVVNATDVALQKDYVGFVKKLQLAISSGNVKTSQSIYDFYPLDKTWKDLKIGDWTFPLFSLAQESGDSPNNIPSPNTIEAVRITWLKHEKDPSLDVPVNIRFFYQTKEEDYFEFGVTWINFKRVLGNSEATGAKKFISDVERGSLQYQRSELQYGLIEKR